MFGEPGFDEPPAGGEIGIVGRQCPNAMQMVRHDDEGVNLEGAGFAHGTKCFAQDFHRCGSGKNGTALLRDYGEEVAAAGGECASILHGVVVGLRYANPTYYYYGGFYTTTKTVTPSRFKATAFCKCRRWVCRYSSSAAAFPVVTSVVLPVVKEVVWRFF